MPSISMKHPGGRPTKYDEHVLAHAQEYVQRHMNLKGKHPYIEELALEMDVDDTTIVNWAEAKNEDGSRKYPEFFATYKKLRTLQKLRLLEKTLFQFPAGAIFQLKANYGMMETEKKLLAGDSDAPLSITITEEKRTPNDD